MKVNIDEMKVKETFLEAEINENGKLLDTLNFEFIKKYNDGNIAYSETLNFEEGGNLVVKKYYNFYLEVFRTELNDLRSNWVSITEFHFNDYGDVETINSSETSSEGIETLKIVCDNSYDEDGNLNRTQAHSNDGVQVIRNLNKFGNAESELTILEQDTVRKELFEYIDSVLVKQWIIEESLDTIFKIYTYNKTNLLETQSNFVVSNGNQNLIQTENYGYDPKGRMVSRKVSDIKSKSVRYFEKRKIQH